MVDSTKIPASGLHDQIDRAASATDEALHRGVERTQTAAHGAVDRGAELASKAQGHYDKVHKHLGQCAHDQPVSTVAIAAGIGALLGLLAGHCWRRRSRNDD